MRTDPAGPLFRPIPVSDLPDEGLDVTIETTADERAALARDFKLPAIQALTGTYHLTGTRSRVHVSGRINATLSQVCVVTLDAFDSTIEEHVDVEFAAPGATPAREGEDAPDEIVNGTVDLGALTAEFFALGLDPYPRKPGVDFAFDSGETRPESPFAALDKLRRDE